jgi:hypothetical protein
MRVALKRRIVVRRLDGDSFLARDLCLQIHEERFTAESDISSRADAAFRGSSRGGGGRGLTAGAAHGAVAKTSGAVSLQLADGAGFAKVRNSGTFIGRVKRGKIVATPNVNVNGCESRSNTNDNMIR